MKVGDLVKTDDWVWSGKKGLIVRIQNVTYCKGAYVLFDNGVHLVRIENLRVLNENR